MKKYYCLILMLFLLQFSNASAGISEIDSLKRLYKSDSYQSLPDSSKADICRRLSIDNVRKSTTSAIQYAEEFYEIAKRMGNLKNEAIALNLIGVCKVSEGNLEKGLEYYLQSLSVRRIIGDSKMISNTLNNIGTVNVRLGEYEKGIGYYNQAFQIRAENNDLDGMAQTLNNLGVTQKLLENYDEAISYFERSLTIKRQLNDKELIASSLNNLGEIAALKGDETQAIAYFNESLECRQMIGDIYGMSRTLVNMSDFMAQQEKYHAALKYLQKALVIITPGFSDTNIYNNPVPGLHSADYNTIIILKNKAVNFRDIYQNEKQNTDDLKVCFDLHVLIIDFIDQIRLGYADEKSKLYLMQENRSIYSDAVTTAIQLLRLTGDKSYKNKAFELEERGNSRILMDLILDVESRVEINIPDSILNDEQEMKKEIAELQKVKIDISDQDVSKLDSIDRQIFEKKRELEHFFQVLEKNYPGYSELKCLPKNPTLEEVQSLLDDETLYLQYHISDTILYTFIITSEQNAIIQTELQPDFYTYLEVLNSFLTGKEKGAFETQNKDFEYAAFRLYEYLVFPVEQFFDKQKLIIIPDGPLFYIPFGVLISEYSETENIGFAHLPYLIQKYPVSYSYSSSMFINSNKTERIAYDEDLVAFALSFKKEVPGNMDSGYSEVVVRNEELGELPGAKAEVEKIVEIIPGRAFYNFLATESNFKNLRGHRKVLHVATHGIINNQKSMFSKLVFEPDSLKGEDGNLYTWELFNMEINADMAVLSACNTGFGKLQLGEGMMTLARGFMVAGVPSLLISLWNVNDAATSTLMTDFYQNLNKGSTKEFALQRAKINYLESSDNIMANPRFWGGFVHLGNTQKLEFGQSSSGHLYLVIAGVFLFSLLIFIVLMRRLK